MNIDKHTKATKQGISSYEKLSTNKTVNHTYYELLSNKQNKSARDVEKIAEYTIRMLYAPGKEMREEADLIIKNCGESKEKFEENLQACKATLVTLKKDLDEMYKNISGRPVKHKFETVLSK